MNFFQKLKDSIYSPAFYAGLPKASTGSAIGYFFLLAVLLTILSSAMPIYEYLTEGRKEIDKFVNQTVTAYPKDLEIKVQNGKASINQQEPYYIPQNTAEGEGKLIVIDTKTPFSAEQFRKYNALAWVTKDSVFVRDDESAQFRTFDLTEVGNFTLNRNVVQQFIGKISPWLAVITPIVVGGIFVGIMFFYTLRLVYLFLLALLILLLLKLMKKPVSYGSAYKIGLHAVTLGLLAEVAISYLRLQSFPFMLTLVTLGVVLFNFLPASHNTRKS